MTSGRHSLLLGVAQMLLRLPAERVIRAAIDGVDGSGKSTFADELAPYLREAGRVVIRASVDGFHHPRAVRYRQGRHSPEGFYHDSYDYAKLKSLLLSPLGPGGSGRYRPAAFDHQTDSPVHAPEERAQPGAILLFDGIFLHRPELRACWDFSIFLEVSFDETFARMARRDGSPADPHAPQNRRYLEGQRLYLSECEPARHATLLIDNNTLDRPYILPPRTRIMSDLSRTRVVHIRHHPYDVYIGRANPRSGLRASPFANPFRIGPDGTREEVMQKYEALMRERLASDELWRERLEALRGRTLGCWCAPEPCHGDVLVRLLDERQGDEEPQATRGE